MKVGHVQVRVRVEGQVGIMAGEDEGRSHAGKG